MRGSMLGGEKQVKEELVRERILSSAFRPLVRESLLPPTSAGIPSREVRWAIRYRAWGDIRPTRTCPTSAPSPSWTGRPVFIDAATSRRSSTP